MFRSPLIYISPLLISLFIYFFYRSEQTLVNHIFNFLLSSNDLSLLRDKVQLLLPLPSIVVYSLPEGLWIFFVTQVSKELIWCRNKRKVSFILLPLLVAITIEIFQYFHITNGTFDHLDLIVAASFWSLSVFLFPPQLDQLKVQYYSNYKTFLFLSSYLIVILSDVF